MDDDDADEAGLFQPVPEGVPIGVVVVDGPGGVSLYRDGRAAFSVLVPGRPELLAPAPGDGLDARLLLRDVDIELGFKLGPLPPGGDGVVLKRGHETITIRKRRGAVSDLTWITVDTVVMGSLAWGEVRTEIPVVLPDSVWVQPGLPIRLRPDKAAGVRADGRAAAALLDLAGDEPPVTAVTAEQRSAAAAALGAQAALAAELDTAHDLRALAEALRQV